MTSAKPLQRFQGLGCDCLCHSDLGKRACLPAFVCHFPWRRKWLPTPIFWSRESHGQRSLAGYSPWCCKELDMTEQLILHYFTSTLRRGWVFAMISAFCWQNSVSLCRVSFFYSKAELACYPRVSVTLFQQHKRRLHTWTSPDGQC